MVLATGIIIYPIPYLVLKLLKEIDTFDVSYFGIHNTINMKNILLNDNISKYYTKDCIKEGTYYCQLNFLLDNNKGGK